MSNPFFDHPILNSPYGYPGQHWELDATGRPTQKIIPHRRKAAFITPVPMPVAQQQHSLDLALDDQHELYSSINHIRQAVDIWRNMPVNTWQVTPETQRLLQFWRNHTGHIRPFFCQVEAVETLIWLTEVAPNTMDGKLALKRLSLVNEDANPGLTRIALKLATGAGKTTVMAMIIIWQTVNACRRAASPRYTRSFLLVTPGITIRDRLRVLQPNDPESYYRHRELVPPDMLADMERAKVVITNYHAFKQRERIDVSAGGRRLLEGRLGAGMFTLETEGQMIQRVMSPLMGSKNIMVINDEAHHCYRPKPPQAGPNAQVSSDQKREAKENTDAARLWVSGIEAVNRQLKVARVVDLSATPFFLQGSGYREGSLFPWTMSDFSLMDAIESGIVKLPRVPIADDLPASKAQVPVFRELWPHIKAGMPQGKANSQHRDPLALPVPLQTALDVLYGHYEKTFQQWQDANLPTHPCFIVVCNNMAASKLVYELIAGFAQTSPDGAMKPMRGRLALFDNFDEHGNPRPVPRTLLIDSGQLESGDALDDRFREVAAPLIERFKKDLKERTNDTQAGEKLADSELLREMLNTVGKPGRLGESVRCVVSVSMLTEGWDTNTVTHVLGVRAFGTQLLCEQVVGRALRRQSYALNDEGKFDVEYADVFGIPFTFTAQPQVVVPKPPVITTHVHAVNPERNALEITFPCVAGYRVLSPDERLTAEFTADSNLYLSRELLGATSAEVSGIVGQPIVMGLGDLPDVRRSTVIYELTQHLLETRWKDANGEPLHQQLFVPLKRIVRQWLDACLTCEVGIVEAQLKYGALAELACEKIHNAITRAESKTRPIIAVLAPYNPTGSTQQVNFNTSRNNLHPARAELCHVNYVVCDSDWEREFARVVEGHPRVHSYVKNQGLGFEVPYLFQGVGRRYLPDFIVRVDDGHGTGDLLNLVVEIKGYRGEDAKAKKETLDLYWVPGVNQLGTHGRWACHEFTEVSGLEENFADLVAQYVTHELNGLLTRVAPVPAHQP